MRAGSIPASLVSEALVGALHAGGHRIPKVAEHHLDRVARLAEDEGGHPRRHEIGRQHHRLLHVAGADAQLLIDHRRVEEEKTPIAARGAALADEVDVVLGNAVEARGMLTGVADRGRGAEDPGVGPVKARDAHEAPQHVGHVRPEDAAIRVDLVDHDVAQVLQRARPRGVMREDARVQHVGVREDHARPLARRPASVTRRVAVVDHGAGVDPGCGHQLAKGDLLVPGERLGRKEVQRSRVRVLGERLQDRQVKAEALAACRGGGDHHVPSGERGLDRERLVGIEALDAPRAQRVLDPPGKWRDGGVGGARPGQGLVGAKARLHQRARQPAGKNGVHPVFALPGGQGHGRDS